jgi:hypothetical protein
LKIRAARAGSSAYFLATAPLKPSGNLNPPLQHRRLWKLPPLTDRIAD